MTGKSEADLLAEIERLQVELEHVEWAFSSLQNFPTAQRDMVSRGSVQRWIRARVPEKYQIPERRI